MSPSINSATSNLYCAEDNATLFENVEDGDSVVTNNSELSPSSLLFNPLQIHSEEFLDDLFKREIKHCPCSDYLNRFTNGELDFNERKMAIDWITKVCSCYNFGSLTAYLSINYLDRFLSACELPKDIAWMMQLLAVACLSLAAKMEEIDVPLSLDFQISKPRFVFEAKTIQGMELKVLSTLEWRMQSVTPFNYLDYFLYRLCGDQMPKMCLLSKATELIASISKGIDFLEFKPSDIAAAVTIFIAVEIHTEQDMYKAVSLLSGKLKKEVVGKCIKMIQDSSVGSGIDDDDDSDSCVNSTLDCSVLNPKRRKLMNDELQ